MCKFLSVVLVMVMLAMAGTAIADTDVSSNITQDTTWTLSGSPYNITGYFIINAGVTLTIENGVTVNNLVPDFINAAGIIIGQATEDNPITFNNVYISPSQSTILKFNHVIWNGGYGF